MNRLTASHIRSSSLKKTLQAYKAHSHKLSTKLDQLQEKKRCLEDKAFVVLDENTVEMSDVSQHTDNCTAEVANGKTAPMPCPPRTSTSISEVQINMIEGEYYHVDDTSLVSRATDILIESVKLRLSYVEEAMGRLAILHREHSKMKVPLELMISRYEEWVRTNQRLFELNSQLYDLEKLKFDRHRRETSTKQSEVLREGIASKGERIGEGSGIRRRGEERNEGEE